MPEPEMQDVVSSNIEKVGYNSETKELHVKFKGNKAIYIYKDVPRGTFDDLLQSESVGKFLCSEIKGKFLFDKA